MFDPYQVLIIASILVTLSYFFNIASKKIRVPSVLFLILTGILIKYFGRFWSVDFGEQLFRVLELLGIVGLIMIVLEASLDLEVTREKRKPIVRSLWLAFLILILSSFAIAYSLQSYLGEEFYNSLVYAIPLCVVSSSVLIPSVHNLTQEKKEFLIYEATFSDVLGIMFFNMIVLTEGSFLFSSSGILMILFTIVVSLVLSYFLVYLFTKIHADLKFFLIIAILLLLYSLGKQMHLSSLLIIFIFGLLLNNTPVFFRGKLSKYMDFELAKKLSSDFRLVTSETAFIVRTFFFVAFGMTLDLSVMTDPKVLTIGTIIIVILYSVRYINFKILLKTDVFPEIFLSPRGLITILLFYSIPMEHQIKNFSTGILFFVIISTGLIMMLALFFSPTAVSSDNFTLIGSRTAPDELERIVRIRKIDRSRPNSDIDDNKPEA